MTASGERVGAWIYSGVWGVLAAWFRVPPEPPSLPVPSGGFVESFRPAPEFLQYLKFWFWLGLLWPDVVIAIVWIAIMFAVPWLGLVLLPVAIALAVLPDVVVYVALHLRYDTTWYVVSDRSLRIRRGIWIIHETTITFENVQNVRITRGPVQRAFGLSTLIVDTAGGGENKQQSSTGHRGVIEGVTDAERWRDLILQRLRTSRTTGLGEAEGHSRQFGSAAHVAVLQEIRDELAQLR
jgi:membrane protein YdbS with pleckstrin-like domain